MHEQFRGRKSRGPLRICLYALVIVLGVAAPVRAQRPMASAVAPPASTFPNPSSTMTAADRQRITASLNQQPIRFEPLDTRGTFLARGIGPAVKLTGTSIDFPIGSNPQRGDPIRIEFAGARAASGVAGTHALPGRVNYLFGDDQSRWRTNVRTYARAHTAALYPGIDIDYYGAGDLLEYDFIVQPGFRADAIRLAVTGAASAAISAAGELVYGPDERVLLRRPIAYQTIRGSRRDVPVDYKRHADGTIGFVVGTYNRTRPLVIDPIIAYSFSFGGSGDDDVLDIAVDNAGAVYIAGSTESRDFPTVNPLQGPGPGTGFECEWPTNEGFTCTSGFLAKLGTDGATLEYATYFGGGSRDKIEHVAVDAHHALYFCGVVDSRPIVAKLSPGGAGVVYRTLTPRYVSDIAVGDDGSAYVITDTGIATVSPQGDYHSIFVSTAPATFKSITTAGGSLYVAGHTTSPGFVTTTGVLQQAFANHRLWVLRDGESLTGSDRGLEDWSGVTGIVVGAADPTVRYAILAKTNGLPSLLARSLDGGVTWVPIDSPSLYLNNIVTDPHDRLTAYALEGVIDARVWNTTNGGTSFTALTVPGSAKSLLIRPTDSTLFLSVIENSEPAYYKSADGGTTWTRLAWASYRRPVAIDSLGRIYAGSLARTSDEGLTWQSISLSDPSSNLPNPLSLLAVGPSQPATLYVSDGDGRVWKTTDDGATWHIVLTGDSGYSAAIHPTSPETVLIWTFSVVLRSTNGGESWTALPISDWTTAVLDPLDPAVVLVGQSQRRDGFVMRLALDGRLVYSTLLGGTGDEVIADIAVDSQGAAYVAGDTSSRDFPFDRGDSVWDRTSPFRTFLVKLSADGGSIGYALPLGDRSKITPDSFLNFFRGALRVGLDAGGNAYTAACTHRVLHEDPTSADCRAFRVGPGGTPPQSASSVPTSRLFALDRFGAQYFANSYATAGAQRQVAVTKYVWGSAAVTSITANLPLPARFATPIAWTAAAVADNPVEYSFWRYDSPRGWTEVQAFGPSAAYTWTPASWDVGDHFLCVFARVVGSAVPPASAVVAFTITGLAPGEPAVLPPAADFNGDLRPDLIWFNETTSKLAAWNMGGGAHGEQLVAGGFLDATPLPDGWRVAGAGDVDGDGHTDLFLQSDTGLIGAWLFEGSVLRFGAILTPNRVSDLAWQIRAVGDFNHDGHPDLVWQHAPTGRVAFWLLNGVNGIGYVTAAVAPPGAEWEIVGTGDSNRDGERDLFLQHRSLGTLAVWRMHGTVVLEGTVLSASPSDAQWHVVAVSDLDGDAFSDLVLQHAGSGQVAAWYLSGDVVRFGAMLNPASAGIAAWKLVGPR